MTILSSILAWEIPLTEESGGLHSVGLQRVGHGLVTKQQQRSIKLEHPIECLVQFCPFIGLGDLEV